MKFKICIIGLGYVGLPLSLEFSKYYNVIGSIKNSEGKRANNFLIEIMNLKNRVKKNLKTIKITSNKNFLKM